MPGASSRPLAANLERPLALIEHSDAGRRRATTSVEVGLHEM
jgi:hypothetical protein